VVEMVRKVKLAIFDNDLKATVGKYEISSDGTKIKVISGGEGHFMPSFGNDSFIDLPYRNIFSPWKISYNRIYFVKKKGDKCVNFQTGEVFNPDPEQLKEAIGATLLGELGKDKTETPIIWYIILLILLGIAGKVFGVLV
jgi:hypothetical protein